MKRAAATPLHDRQWRLGHVYSVVDKASRQRVFRPNPIQARILADPSPRKMFLKARQVGISTSGILEMFDHVIHTPNTTACILAHEQDSIRKLFQIVHRAYDFLEPELKPQLDRGGGSKYEFYFPLLNSRIYCDLESRGDTIHWLHASEAAFFADTDKLKATLQAVPIATGRVSIESTANGMGNLFYEMWMDAEQPYQKFFFPWFLMPEYRITTDPLALTADEHDFIRKAKTYYGVDIDHAQIAFRRFKQRELKALFLQEYPEDDVTCFLSSGNAFMNLFRVKDQIAAARRPIEDHDGLRVFVPYNNAHLYACGVDVAEGVGADWSVASVFDATTWEQVACLRKQSKPSDFAHDTVALLSRYVSPGRPWPLLGVERNNHGHSMLLELHEHIGYANLYQTADERVGWLTDRVTRPIMLDALRDGVENRTVVVNDAETLAECLTFVDIDGKPEAAEGRHDDCVMAAAIAVQMCVEQSVSRLYDNIRDRILV